MEDLSIEVVYFIVDFLPSGKDFVSLGQTSKKLAEYCDNMNYNNMAKYSQIKKISNISRFKNLLLDERVKTEILEEISPRILVINIKNDIPVRDRIKTPLIIPDSVRDLRAKNNCLDLHWNNRLTKINFENVVTFGKAPVSTISAKMFWRNARFIEGSRLRKLRLIFNNKSSDTVSDVSCTLIRIREDCRNIECLDLRIPIVDPGEKNVRQIFRIPVFRNLKRLSIGFGAAVQNASIDFCGNPRLKSLSILSFGSSIEILNPPKKLLHYDYMEIVNRNNMPDNSVINIPAVYKLIQTEYEIDVPKNPHTKIFRKLYHCLSYKTNIGFGEEDEWKKYTDAAKAEGISPGQYIPLFKL